MAVRRAVGIFDASTLGKIEVVGRDAAEFLDRLYVNPVLNLGEGRCRYAVMLKEDGYVFDDGIVARLASDRFHLTTTTNGAQRVLSHMEDYLQTEWPGLEVFLTSVTEQWASIAVHGPKAREVVAPLISGVDMSPEAFPHMCSRQGLVCEIPARLFRLSFTGESGYEINVPAGHAVEVWERIFERGQAYGIQPYGTEALHILRAERGFIAVGQETDGTVTPDDLGLLTPSHRSKADFVGKRSLARADLSAPLRKQLVGLLTENPEVVLDEGAQILASPKLPTPIESLGHVTSSYWSSNCGRSIALALLANGRALTDKTLHVTTPTGYAAVRVAAPAFFDARGERVHA